VGSLNIAAYALKEKVSVIICGGYAKISVFGLNELDIIQSTGKAGKTAPISNARNMTVL
jgi:hypothetical protein